MWARLLDTELKHYSFTLTQTCFANSFPANSDQDELLLADAYQWRQWPNKIKVRFCIVDGRIFFP